MVGVSKVVWSKYQDLVSWSTHQISTIMVRVSWLRIRIGSIQVSNYEYHVAGIMVEFFYQSITIKVLSLRVSCIGVTWSEIIE